MQHCDSGLVIVHFLGLGRPREPGQGVVFLDHSGGKFTGGGTTIAAIHFWRTLSGKLTMPLAKNCVFI